MGSGVSKKSAASTTIESTPVVPFDNTANNSSSGRGNLDTKQPEEDANFYYVEDSETANAAQLKNYLTDIFAAYNATGRGLRAEDIVAMMTDMLQYNGSRGARGSDTKSNEETDLITIEDAAYVVKSMDKDNNGQIDLSEFTKWIKNGQSKSPQDLIKLSQHSDRSKRLVDFLTTILSDVAENDKRQKKMLNLDEGGGGGGGPGPTPETKEEQYNNEDGVSSPSSLPALPNKNYFATWLKDTFTHFDTNGNEKLDKDELFRLCLHIKRWTIRKYSDLWMSPMYNNSLYRTVLQCLEAFSPRDATMILNSIDKDKNGTIDFDEFSLWLSRGFQKNITILNKLSKRSTNSATMIALVVGFRFCLINTIVSKSDLEKSLIALFEQYDKDGNGHLDREELLVMIRGIEDTVQVVGNNEQAILAETSALIHGQSFTMTDDDIAYILGSMDTDGNGTLELPEWIAWLRGKEGRGVVVVWCGGVWWCLLVWWCLVVFIGVVGGEGWWCGVVVFGGVWWCLLVWWC